MDHVSAARVQMIAQCEDALRHYRERIDRGVAKEIARMALPQNVHPQACWTVSLPGVIHFLHPDARYEFRRYAEEIYQVVGEDPKTRGLSRK